jgi:hypothetical protein
MLWTNALDRYSLGEACKKLGHTYLSTHHPCGADEATLLTRQAGSKKARELERRFSAQLFVGHGISSHCLEPCIFISCGWYFPQKKIYWLVLPLL